MKLLVADMVEVRTELMLKFSLPDDNSEFFNLKSKVVWARKGSNTVLGVRFEKLSENDYNRIVRYVEAELSKTS